MQRPPLMKEEYECAVARRNEPEQHVDEVYPDGVLHTLNAAVSFRILVDEQAAEDAEDGDPESTTLKSAFPFFPFRGFMKHLQEYEIPDKQDPALEYRDHVD